MSPLWINDPSILFKKNQILELWPVKTLSYNNKINAIVRIILILTLIGVIISKTYFICVVSFCFVVEGSRCQKKTKAGYDFIFRETLPFDVAVVVGFPFQLRGSKWKL